MRLLIGLNLAVLALNLAVLGMIVTARSAPVGADPGVRTARDRCAELAQIAAGAYSSPGWQDWMDMRGKISIASWERYDAECKAP